MFTKVLHKKSSHHSLGRMLVITGILVCLSLFVSMVSHSQTCLPEGIEFTTQSQIDSFPILYPNCSEIEGDVYLGGSDISNLNGLSILTSIGGYLLIGNYSYSANPILTSLTGLENLTSTGGSVFIMNNYVLSSLSGLDNLTSIGGFVRINGNDALGSLQGLNNLTSIGEFLTIYENNTLTSLTGLENVTSIDGKLWIESNDSLTSLMGLMNLTHLSGYINISGNVALRSLEGLDNIDATIIDKIEIYYNNSLSTCEVQSICNYLSVPNADAFIFMNKSGCDSIAEVKEACAHVGISEIIENLELSIYPNPSSSIFTISGIQGPIEKVSIYNKLGQRVLYEMKPDNTIDVSWLPWGLYIVEVLWDGHRVREKLIVQ